MNSSIRIKSNSEVDRANEILKRLKKEYPVAKIALEFQAPFQLLISTILSIIQSAAGATALTANVASIDITPPLEMKYTLGGYGERMNNPAEGIHDPIMAKALALKSGD